MSKVNLHEEFTIYSKQFSTKEYNRPKIENLIEKRRQTPKKYPRKAGNPNKSPIE